MPQQPEVTAVAVADGDKSKNKVQKRVNKIVGIATGLVLTFGVFWGGYRLIKWWNPDPPPGGSPAAGGQPSDPKLESTCADVPEIPLGKVGDFCAFLKGGAPTGRIKPPPHTNVGIYPVGPAEIKFFDDWDDGKLVKTVRTTKENRRICFPEVFTSFTVTMEKDDTLRVRIGGRRSPEFVGKCS